MPSDVEQLGPAVVEAVRAPLAPVSGASVSSLKAEANSAACRVTADGARRLETEEASDPCSSAADRGADVGGGGRFPTWAATRAALCIPLTTTATAHAATIAARNGRFRDRATDMAGLLPSVPAQRHSARGA